MTKRWTIIAAGVSALAVAPPAIAAAKPAAPMPDQGLAGLISSDDYPIEALQRSEQGNVSVHLLVGTDGRVKRCEITQSSNSEPLDSTTCEILVERARFSPATDAKGRPIEGTFNQTIAWRLVEVEEPATRQQAILLMWMTCTMGETAKLAITDLSPEQIRDRALAACVSLERMVEAEIAASTLPGEDANFGELRKSVGNRVFGWVKDMRIQLERKD